MTNTIVRKLRKRASRLRSRLRPERKVLSISPPSVEELNRRDFSPGQRPLRIVAHNFVYPLISETYIGDELEALRRCGLDIVLSRARPAVTPTASRVDVPLFESLDAAISHHDPDLVITHWASVALSTMRHCLEARIPFAVRTHSFEWAIEDSEFLNAWCVGLWHLPHRGQESDRVFHLPTLIVQDSPRKVFSNQRSRSVVSVSAGLPKKDWPLLMESVSAVPNLPLEVVIALTNGHEKIHEVIAKEAAVHEVDCTLSVNVPYDAVQEKLDRHGVFVYSIGAGEPIGQPRSVIEGALAGIPLVVPDHPGIRGIVGDCAHFYQQGDSRTLTQALREALDSPVPMSTRQLLAQRVWDSHANPDVFEKWAKSLTDAYIDWRSLASSGEGLGARVR